VAELTIDDNPLILATEPSANIGKCTDEFIDFIFIKEKKYGFILYLIAVKSMGVFGCDQHPCSQLQCGQKNECVSTQRPRGLQGVCR
jgi:hypothetical protein